MLRDMIDADWAFLDVTSVGVLYADIPTSGTHGPSALYNDDIYASNYYRIKKTSEPPSGTLFLNIDGSGYGTSPSVTPVEVFENGASIGTTTISILDNAVFGTADLSSQSSIISGTGFTVGTNVVTGTGGLVSTVSNISGTLLAAGSETGSGAMVAQDAHVSGSAYRVGWNPIEGDTNVWTPCGDNSSTWNEI